MMQPRRPSSPGPDCTCAECTAAARIARIILIGSATAWTLIVTALLSLIA